MASIATVVTRGFGSFGSVNLLPTLGYGVGAVPGGGIIAIVPRHRLTAPVPRHRLTAAVSRPR